MKSRSLLVVFIFTTASMAILTRPGSTQSGPEPVKLEEDRLPCSFHRPPIDTLRLRLLSGTECWTGMKGIKGCIWQIYDFLFAGSLSQIGRECCYAFEAIGEDCWPQMFPLQPSYGPSIKTQCDMIVGNML